MGHEPPVDPFEHMYYFFYKPRPTTSQSPNPFSVFRFKTLWHLHLGKGRETSFFLASSWPRKTIPLSSPSFSHCSSMERGIRTISKYAQLPRDKTTSFSFIYFIHANLHANLVKLGASRITTHTLFLVSKLPHIQPNTKQMSSWPAVDWTLCRFRQFESYAGEKCGSNPYVGHVTFRKEKKKISLIPRS